MVVPEAFLPLSSPFHVSRIYLVSILVSKSICFWYSRLVSIVRLCAYQLSACRILPATAGIEFHSHESGGLLAEKTLEALIIVSLKVISILYGICTFVKLVSASDRAICRDPPNRASANLHTDCQPSSITNPSYT